MRAARRIGLTATTLAIGGLLASGGMVRAADVTLRTRDGDFAITGEIQAYQDGKYTLLSKTLGSMTLDATRFECVGNSCPKAPLIRASAAISIIPGAPAAVIAIAGSNTIGNQLMPALIQAYAAATSLNVVKQVGANPLDLQLKLDQGGRDAGTVNLQRHGSTTAFKELEAKRAVIGMSSRVIKADEVTKLAAAGLGDMKTPGNEHILGLDGLQVLVAPDSPLVTITLDVVAKIFAGQIKNWSELGLPAGAINVSAPTPDTGTIETFDQIVLKPRKLDITAAAKRTENHAEQSDWVARDRNAIGFAGIAYQRNAKALNIELACGLISVPSVFSVKTEEYPLSRRLYLYTAGQPNEPLARNLLSFALSPAAQAIVKQNDFIDQAPELIGYDAQAARIASAFNAPAEDFDATLMRELTTEIKGAERLSVTFRFQKASFVLDNKALSDVARLRTILQTPQMQNRTVTLVGFADSRGDFASNTRLSDRRARSVLTALTASPGNRAGNANNVRVKAFSELAPVSCNTIEEGRELNRRVEVWVR